MKKFFQIVLVLGVVLYISFLISWFFNYTQYKVETVEVDTPYAAVVASGLNIRYPWANRFFEKYRLEQTIKPADFPGFFKTTIDSTLVGSYCE